MNIVNKMLIYCQKLAQMTEKGSNLTQNDEKWRKMKENLRNDAQNRELLGIMPKKGNQLDFLVKMWYNVRG